MDDIFVWEDYTKGYICSINGYSLRVIPFLTVWEWRIFYNGRNISSYKLIPKICRNEEIAKENAIKFYQRIVNQIKKSTKN